MYICHKSAKKPPFPPPQHNSTPTEEATVEKTHLAKAQTYISQQDLSGIFIHLCGKRKTAAARTATTGATTSERKPFYLTKTYIND